MSEQEEQEFLRPWAEQALAGGVVVSERGNFGRLPAWVAKGGTGYSSSQQRSANPRGLEKNLPEDLAALLTADVVDKRKVDSATLNWPTVMV